MERFVIPHFAGIKLAYTEIDAAYVWTDGGYQVARSHDDDPVCIQVHDPDVERWIGFFEEFGVERTTDQRPDGIDVEWVDGTPVIPLEAVVEQMTENRPAYEPALELIAEEYDLDIDAIRHDELTVD